MLLLSILFEISNYFFLLFVNKITRHLFSGDLLSRFKLEIKIKFDAKNFNEDKY